MTANVAMIIIPNQRIVVADLKAGRVPDAKYGKIAKLRSTHNNYLTLPVIFLMLANHYPLAFATEWSWLIAALVFLMGVSIRHFFNTMHAKKGRPWWSWGVTVLIFAAIVWLSLSGGETLEEAEARVLTPYETRLAEAEGFEDAHDLVLGHCSYCHAREPLWPGIAAPPKGVVLETPADIARHAREIYLQAGVTRAMPPPSVSALWPEDRAVLRDWYEAGRL